MSRVDDSDNERIRQMQEQSRARKDAEKKDTETRTTKSFQEVMRDRTQKQMSQKASAQDQTKGKQAQDKTKQEQGSFAQQLLKKLPKEGADIQKRAAMSRAMQSSMQATRSQDSQKAREAEAERADDLVKKADDDKDRVEKDMREEGDREIKQKDDRDAQFHKIDPDQDQRGGDGQKERQQRERGNDDGRGERKAQSVEAAQAPKQEAAPRGIPPEVIEKMVNAIHAAVHADGRTEMQVELKGTMLEGVKLKVRSERGKVSCTFEGADKQLKNLLESSKGALMRSLEKRGLTLTSMKVV